MLYTAHTTRLLKCHTQPVRLDKQRRKKSRTYLRVNVNDHSRKGKSDNICVVKDEGPVSCQLRDTYLYNTYIVVVVVVVAAELVVQESVLTYSTKKGFTYKSCQ